MTNTKNNNLEKQSELIKYRDLVLSTLDYYIDFIIEMPIKTPDFDSVQHFQGFKMQTEEHFKKGRLSKLKQWFRELTEMPIETGDLKFNEYLKNKTKYDIDIFQSYYKRVDKIIEKGKITSDNQFYDVNIMVDQLCKVEPVDDKRIDVLNKLLRDYELRK
jgi:hypothetical protein